MLSLSLSLKCLCFIARHIQDASNPLYCGKHIAQISQDLTIETSYQRGIRGERIVRDFTELPVSRVFTDVLLASWIFYLKTGPLVFSLKNGDHKPPLLVYHLLNRAHVLAGTGSLATCPWRNAAMLSSPITNDSHPSTRTPDSMLPPTGLDMSPSSLFFFSSFLV